MQSSLISKEMQNNLKSLGFNSFTAIQELALPYVLEGKDIIAKAKTGSGKTAAFGIGVIENLDIKRHGVQVLVLTPTRELAQQVSSELRKLARAKANTKILLLSGGHSFGYQLSSLKHEAHIVVGTPGRVLKHLKKGSLKLDKLNTLILDEADRVLDMGFISEVEEIISFTNKGKNTLLFSATFNEEIREISKKFQNSPIEIEAKDSEDKPLIEHYFCDISNKNKQEAIVDLLSHFKPKSTIIFVNTKIEASNLANYLYSLNIDAKAIHGDLEQIDRSDTLMQFANESICVLVATDVAARGLDIKGAELVINYDLPRDIAIYIHRVGRVGRAGAKGVAISLKGKECEICQEIKEHYKNELTLKELSTKKRESGFKLEAKYKTISILGGRKDKLRAGDILGALAKNGGFKGSDIGKIDISDRDSFVAIKQEIADSVYKFLQNAKIKNRKFRVEMLS